MDAVTLTLAKQYTDSQRLAYTEGQAPITWDGDITGRVVIPAGNGLYSVRVSEQVWDLKNATSVKVTQVGEGAYAEFNGVIEKKVSVFETDDGSGVVGLLDADNNTDMLVMIQPEDVQHEDIVIPKGIYFRYQEFQMSSGGELVKAFTSEINFAESVHPIDPKFIPAVDALILNGADGKQYRIAVDETGTLTTTEVAGG